MSNKEPVGFGDKALTFHTKKDEKGNILGTKVHEQNESSLLNIVDKIPENRFCLDCGETLTPILIFICKHCGQRYLVQYDNNVNKPIIVPMGKEPELTKLDK